MSVENITCEAGLTLKFKGVQCKTVSPRLLFGFHVNNFKGCTRDQPQGTFTKSEEDHPVTGIYNWNWTWNQSHSQNLGQ